MLLRMAEYYSKIHSHFWFELVDGLSFPPRHVAMLNQFASFNACETLRKQYGTEPVHFRKIPQRSQNVVKMSLQRALREDVVSITSCKHLNLSGTLRDRWKVRLTPRNLDKFNKCIADNIPLSPVNVTPLDIYIHLRNTSLPGEEIQDYDDTLFENDFIDQINKLDTRSTPLCEITPDSSEYPNPPDLRQNGDHLPYYLLDLASLLPVFALDVRKGDYVLDMCAAPGGKSVAILQLLQGTGMLVANDVVESRKKRLVRTLTDYIPKKILEQQTSVTMWDGAVFGKEEANSFDKVLVDAPCSADRHVILEHLTGPKWSITKAKANAARQRNLLTSALKAVKPGGTVVYSTCALSPIENDDVVEHVVDKCRHEHGIFALIDTDDYWPTLRLFPGNTFGNLKNVKHGVLVTPLTGRNWGPIYFSKIIRLS